MWAGTAAICRCPAHIRLQLEHLPAFLPLQPTPDPDGKMGDYAIQAAVNTYQQAKAVGMNTMVRLETVGRSWLVR